MPQRAAAPGKAEIYGAIRPGTRLCRRQREYLRTGLGLIEAQSWYANRKAHYAAVFGRLALTARSIVLATISGGEASFEVSALSSNRA